MENVASRFTWPYTLYAGSTATSAVLPTTALAGKVEPVTHHNVASTSTYGVKMPTYKAPGDMEIFISRFEQYCVTQNVEETRKANLLLTALDDSTFTVVKRELTDNERSNYDTIKKHLEKRFDLLKDAGQKRLIFRQARREQGQTIEEFYTQLLGMAAKAFPGESGQAVDRMILDQLICGCSDEKIRFQLIEKAPATSRDALSLAVAYQAAIKYNDSLKENVLVSTMPIDEYRVDYRNRSNERNRDYFLNRRGEEYYDKLDKTYNKFNRGRSEEISRGNRNNGYNSRERQEEERRHGGSNFSPGRIFSESERERQLRSQERKDSRFNTGNQMREENRGILRNNYRGNLQNERFQDNFRPKPFKYQQFRPQPRNTIQETQRSVRYNRAGYTNTLSSPSHLFYVNGMFGRERLPILIDSGSAVTIIDEEIWNLIRGERDTLDKVPFSIRSATKHTLEILGQKTIPLSILYKHQRGSKDFRTNVIVVKGLTHKAIIGLDFLKKYAASMDLWNRKLILFTRGSKSVHQLMEKKMEFRNVQIITSETFELTPRTQTRIECKVGNEIKDGVVVYFEPNEEINHLPIAIAGSIDIIHEGSITTQIVNTTFEKFILQPGTVIGSIEVIPDKFEGRNQQKEDKQENKSEEWLKHMDIGEDIFGENEIIRIKNLMREYKDVFSQNEYDLGRSDLVPRILYREYKDVFSQNEYDLGRSDLVPHTIEIVGEKPKRSGVRPLNPALRKEVEEQLKILQENDMIEPSKSEYACPGCARIVVSTFRCGRDNPG